MAAKTIAQKRQQQEGFDVTCVIGRVVPDGSSDETPYEAAFKLIAQHGAEGQFTFPGSIGDTIRVTVEYEMPDSAGVADDRF